MQKLTGYLFKQIFLQSKKSQAQFLKDMISLSKKIKNIFVILRFKSVNDWKFDSSFKTY